MSVRMSLQVGALAAITSACVVSGVYAMEADPALRERSTSPAPPNRVMPVAPAQHQLYRENGSVPKGGAAGPGNPVNPTSTRTPDPTLDPTPTRKPSTGVAQDTRTDRPDAPTRVTPPADTPGPPGPDEAEWNGDGTVHDVPPHPERKGTGGGYGECFCAHPHDGRHGAGAGDGHSCPVHGDDERDLPPPSSKESQPSRDSSADRG